jgi:phage/conjugal plasmid C-4 type zinc finger TraR family protein
MPDIVDTAAEIVADWNTRCIAEATRGLAQPGTLICEDCEVEIPARRREHMPSATRCAPCQQLLEGRRRAR